MLDSPDLSEFTTNPSRPPTTTKDYQAMIGPETDISKLADLPYPHELLTDHRPQAFMVFGHPGSGKSLLSQRLAQSLEEKGRQVRHHDWDDILWTTDQNNQPIKLPPKERVNKITQQITDDQQWVMEDPKRIVIYDGDYLGYALAHRLLTYKPEEAAIITLKTPGATRLWRLIKRFARQIISDQTSGPAATKEAAHPLLALRNIAASLHPSSTKRRSRLLIRTIDAFNKYIPIYQIDSTKKVKHFLHPLPAIS